MANNRFNVKNVHYAINKVAEGGTVTRETPVLIAGAMKVSVNPTVATGKLYGDGIVTDEITKLTGAGISLEMNKIPTEVINVIFNRKKDIGTGITKDSIANEPIEFSLGWEVELTGGHSEFVWFTKCKATPIQSEVQQSSENMTFSTDTMTITAMPDENGDIRLFGETVDKGFKCKDTWFKSIPPVAGA